MSKLMKFISLFCFYLEFATALIKLNIGSASFTCTEQNKMVRTGQFITSASSDSHHSLAYDNNKDRFYKCIHIIQLLAAVFKYYVQVNAFIIFIIGFN